MNSKIWNYFEIAGEIASKRKDMRSFLLAAVGVRSDGAMVHAVNGHSQMPERTAHAEARLCKKLDVGSEIFICRIRLLNGSFALSKPCRNCEKMLRTCGVKRVYYTTGADTYDCLILNNKIK